MDILSDGIGYIQFQKSCRTIINITDIIFSLITKSSLTKTLFNGVG